MASDQLELRGRYDRDLVAALDMIAQGKGLTVTALVGRVLVMYVRQKQHEASLLVRLPVINPPPPDSEWSSLE